MDIIKERRNIDEVLQRLQNKTESLIRKLGEYGEEKIMTPVAPGVWSTIQTMGHILMSEKLSLNYVKKKLSFNPQLKKAGLKAFIRFQVLKFYLGSSLKFKAPKGVQSEDLPAFSSLTELAAHWKSDRQKLVKFFDKADNEILDRELYRHPLVGRLTLLQMLHFFEGHFDRHRKQILQRLH